MAIRAIKKKAMLAALENTLGIVTSACKAVGISTSTHYNWLNNDAEYRAAVEHIENTGLDYAESKLFQLMEGVQVRTKNGEFTGVYKTPPNVAAVIFYLKTKGKGRGYIENPSVTAPIGFNWVALAAEAGDAERDVENNLTDIDDASSLTMLGDGGVQVIDVEGRTIDDDRNAA